ncbi:MAG: hypothetical protein HW384_1236, partial [Dehalococcoidia bacterium]|nr:hypothetical protein [Dehalococcoidia bacterium]
MLRRWLDWIGGALVGGVIIGFANATITWFRQLEPIHVFAIWFVIAFVIIVGITKWQEERLKRLLKTKEDRWNRVREERTKLRQVYANRTELPKLLNELHQCNIEIVGKQKISKKQAQPLAKAFFLRCINLKLLWSVFYFFVPFFRKWFPSYTEKTTVEYAMTFNAVLKDFKLGSLSIMSSPVYLSKYHQIREYEIGLPSKLIDRITGYIVLSNALSSLMLMREGSGF